MLIVTCVSSSRGSIQSHRTSVHPCLLLCQRFVTSIYQRPDRQLQSMKSFSMRHVQTLARKPLGKEMDGELWIWTRPLSPSYSVKPCTQRVLSTLAKASCLGRRAVISRCGQHLVVPSVSQSLWTDSKKRHRGLSECQHGIYVFMLSVYVIRRCSTWFPNHEF